LIDAGLPNQAIKWILRLFEYLTANVSRGVPVGPHPVHLLAEATLIPLDNALTSRGIGFIRYVDDIVVFARDQTECRKHLYTIADVLDKQQRLILNKSKTRLLNPDELRGYAAKMIEDRPISATESDLLDVIRKYSGGNPYATIMLSKIAPADLALLAPDFIESILSDYLAQSPVEFIRLRWFLRRITQIGHPGGVRFCLANLERLIPALSAVCHYFLSVALSGSHDMGAVAAELIAALEMELVSAWPKTGQFLSRHEAVN
jgi:hypothetical protein